MPRGMTITVDDDEQIADTNEAPRPRGRVQVDDVGFADLRDQLDRANKERDEERRARDEERRARESAETRANQNARDADAARREASAARTEGAEGKKLAIQNAHGASKQLLDSLEAEHAAAMDAGDFRKASQINRRMQEESARFVNLETGLAEFTEDRTAGGAVERRAEPESRRTEPVDEFEKYLGQFGPNTQDWLRRHRECVTDQVKNAQVIAAHHEALQKGYKAESEAYWSYLENKMGYRADAARRAARLDNDDDPDAGDDPEPEVRETRGRSMAAPTPRATRGNGGRRSTEVTLTAGEVMNATDGTIVWNVGNVDHRGVIITEKDPRVGNPIGEYEFARRKKSMQGAGRYAVPYTD